MKRLMPLAAAPGRVGKWINDPKELNHRTGPAMHDQQRKGIGAR